MNKLFSVLYGTGKNDIRHIETSQCTVFWVVVATMYDTQPKQTDQREFNIIKETEKSLCRQKLKQRRKISLPLGKYRNLLCGVSACISEQLYLKIINP